MTLREVIGEVEKRYDLWRDKESAFHSIETEARMSECQHLLLLLRSLDDESLSNEEDTCKELEEAAKEYSGKEAYPINSAFRAGAMWQKEKDEEEKVLLFKHGFDHCKEQMMSKAINGEIKKIYRDAVMVESVGFSTQETGCFDGDEVKVIVIKDDGQEDNLQV